MHCKYDVETRIVKRYGNIACITKAIWKKKSMDVQEINATKGIRYKGVYYTGLCGYGIVFDYESTGRGYWYVEPRKQEWTEFKTKIKKSDPYESYVIYDGAIPTYEEMELIYSVYPDFRYVYKKKTRDLTKQEVVRLLRVWQLHKQDVEFLIAMGRYDLCFKKSIYTSKAQTKKRMCEILYKAKCMNLTYITITELRGLAKGKLDIDSLLLWKKQTGGRLEFDVWSKCVKDKLTQEETEWFIGHYNDYLRVAKVLGHDVTEDYWKYPKDLKAAHDKVMKEQDQANYERQKKYWLKASEVCKKYIKYNTEINGYQFIISTDRETWEQQANVLSQCIIRCNYIQQVANRTCLLVFIRKDNEPVATAQLYENKKLGQFYADEADINNCRPSEEVTLAFNAWLKNVKIGARI